MTICVNIKGAKKWIMLRTYLFEDKVGLCAPKTHQKLRAEDKIEYWLSRLICVSASPMMMMVGAAPYYKDDSLLLAVIHLVIVAKIL